MDLREKKVLITGSEGFIGSQLVDSLLDKGCQIKGFVYYNAFNSWGWLDNFPKNKLKNIEIFAGDIRDANGVRNAVKGMDVVFHLAALIGIPFSYHSPDAYVDTNIKGTLNILQACRDFDIEKVLVTSTSEVYGTAKYVPMDEQHPLQGQSPYSATKIAADAIAESFYRSFKTPVVIVRPFNTYGPRQSARAIIPTVITQCLSGVKSIKLGALSPTRDFTYVKDTVEGFIGICKSDKTIGEKINIASQQEIAIVDLAKKIINKIGCDVEIATDDLRIRPEKSEVERLLGANEKIRNLTTWKTMHNIDDGLEQTIEWFKDKENLKLYKPDIYNV